MPFETRRRAGTALRRGFRDLQSVLALLALLLVWELATAAFASPFFPRPTAIVANAAQKWFSGPASRLAMTDEFMVHVVPSVGRLLAAWMAGGLIGAALGLVLGLNRTLLSYVDPIIQLCRSIPPPALIPAFMILLGTGFGMRFAFIAFGVVWIVLLNTIAGAKAVEPVQVDSARAFRASAWRTLTEVMLPAASPHIAVGLRLSLSAALILMVVSEMVASSEGIGFTLIQAQRSFAILDMWASMLMLAVLGYLLNLILVLGEGRLLSWHRGAHRRQP